MILIMINPKVKVSEGQNRYDPLLSSTYLRVQLQLYNWTKLNTFFSVYLCQYRFYSNANSDALTKIIIKIYATEHVVVHVNVRTVSRLRMCFGVLPSCWNGLRMISFIQVVHVTLLKSR